VGRVSGAQKAIVQTRMKITFCCADTRIEPWIKDFSAALPEAQFTDWFAQGEATPAADYAVVWAPPQAFFDSQPSLKAAFNIGAGVNAILALPRVPTIPIVRLEDAGMAAQMADYVAHAVLRHFREFDAFETTAKAGEWKKRRPLKRADFPIGVLGLGTLGSHVAKVITAFDFPVLGWSNTRKHKDGVRTFHGAGQLDAFLTQTRVLVCLLPLTEQTTGIINGAALSKLLPGAYVINVARGAHMVDADLIAAIDSGHVAGATLDVFHTEPLPPEHAFWKSPKITITPHISAVTLREESVAQIAGKMLALQRGEAITGIVDRMRGY
jgi:glyoxylate/hydroxypyruvate reductase